MIPKWAIVLAATALYKAKTKQWCSLFTISLSSPQYMLQAFISAVKAAGRRQQECAGLQWQVISWLSKHTAVHQTTAHADKAWCPKCETRGEWLTRLGKASTCNLPHFHLHTLCCHCIDEQNTCNVQKTILAVCLIREHTKARADFRSWLPWALHPYKSLDYIKVPSCVRIYSMHMCIYFFTFYIHFFNAMNFKAFSNMWFVK